MRDNWESPHHGERATCRSCLSLAGHANGGLLEDASIPPATLRATSVEPPYQIFSPTLSPLSFCNFFVTFNHYGNVRKVFVYILLPEDGISRNNTPKGFRWTREHPSSTSKCCVRFITLHVSLYPQHNPLRSAVGLRAAPISCLAVSSGL